MASTRFAPLLPGGLASAPLIRASFFNVSFNAIFRIHWPSTPSVFAGLCHLVQATNNKDVLNQCTDAVKDVLNNAKHAASRREVLHTNFLSPPVLKESLSQIEKLSDVKAIPQGGYPEAERCRLSVGNSETLTHIHEIVVGLCITGNFVFQPCSHGDFLGAILGTGIQRDMLGDIILQGEKGAQILIVPEIVSFLLSSLIKVGKVPVSCREIPLHTLEYTPRSTKLSKSVEASSRLDAVGSAGFKISRAKMASLISKDEVSVNWTSAKKNSALIKSGDIISVKGNGRLKIREIETTKKGKFVIEFVRYL